MKELVEVIAKSLVDHPEEVVVTEKEDGENLILELVEPGPEPSPWKTFLENQADFLPNRISAMTSANGKTLPASIPVWSRSPACAVTVPTRLGPMAPPRSPDIASKANRAVPPWGRRGEVMLRVPSQRIPTEKPQKMQPSRPITGFEDKEASR